ncbi:MAG: Benzoyl-CoA reductase, bzd-type, subunit [Dehalococcoidia bacterium]|nr:Benzoyl-CoA reductase, bzd-type, subunit [Dehalococcoidia bacterium]
MSTTVKRYITKPLECWAKAKELRLEYYRQVSEAKSQGKLLVTGSGDSVVTLPAGLGDYVFFQGEPYGASIAMDPAFSEECCEAVEARGFARDLCAYMRNFWGSMFLNKYYFGGGGFPRPDFGLPGGFCDTHIKWYQVVCEYLGVPFFGIDIPVGVPGQNEEAKVAYLAAEMNEAIEWMKKLTGRDYDDQKLIEAARNEFKSSALWGEVLVCNQAIPAPLDQRQIFTLYILSLLRRQEKETVRFYEMLLDEVKDRVKEGIAALATERYRAMEDSQPPWYFLEIYKYLEKYGVVVVGSHYSFFLGGTLSRMADGSLGPPRTPDQLGWPMQTREEVLRALARWYIRKPTIQCFGLPEVKSRQMIELVKGWYIDGVIMHLNRGCEGTAMGQMENRLALLKAGIPLMTYEGNMADRREFDQVQTLKRIDAFMESQGLSMLEV